MAGNVPPREQKPDRPLRAPLASLERTIVEEWRAAAGAILGSAITTGTGFLIPPPKGADIFEQLDFVKANQALLGGQGLRQVAYVLAARRLGYCHGHAYVQRLLVPFMSDAIEPTKPQEPTWPKTSRSTRTPQVSLKASRSEAPAKSSEWVRLKVE